MQHPSPRAIDRDIATLALPALGALIAEPLFLVADSALVGHLGAAPLAGLAIASTVLQTAVGLMVFLAYATTPLVARRAGAGDLRGAVQAGIDGLWLACVIGIALGIGLWATSPTLLTFFSATPDVAAQALSYLTISCIGLPAMLIVFAATGLLRGLQDTRTPLYVAGVSFTANALLNWWFIYGFGWGIAGSALGTVIAQWGMVVCYLFIVSHHARQHGASYWPQRAGLSAAGVSGAWLFLRTIGLRVALLATVSAAATHGTVTVAGYQIVFTLFSTTAFTLDALAIAAQVLIARALGAADERNAREVLRRSVYWGVVCGAVLGAGIACASPILGMIFTSETLLLAALPPALIVLGVSLPLCGFVFVLDGVLMGAGDARYLAWSSLLNLAIYLPALWAVTALAPSDTAALISITAAFTIVFMLARALTLGFRARGSRWVTRGSLGDSRKATL